jgi:hypothetical protein
MQPLCVAFVATIVLLFLVALPYGIYRLATDPPAQTFQLVVNEWECAQKGLGQR